VRKRFSTSTLVDSGRCVPWLAADGPLAYSPENPPARDYFFQYGWILPQIFKPDLRDRGHRYFGTPIREDAEPLFEFWRQARDGSARRVYCSLGVLNNGTLSAPIAVYRAKQFKHRAEEWLLIQHGSYQWISLADQPHVGSGQVLLYRGIQKERTFRYPMLGQALHDRGNRGTWNQYIDLQWRMLSDSVLSFNTIHDRTKRCETGFLNDGTWLADTLGREAGLNLESDAFTRTLWRAAMTSFSLARGIGQAKFGPHFVIAKTPLTNIRLTTFFAGEAEVRVVDPRQIQFVGTVGCTVEA
jgi:hypothetical protein